MYSTRSCNTSYPYLKPHVEQAFARLEASLLVAVNAEVNRCATNNCSPECKSQAPHSSAGMIVTADRSSEPAQHGNRHLKQSGVARSTQSSKKPRR